jgi:hypothetical protein
VIPGGFFRSLATVVIAEIVMIAVSIPIVWVQRGRSDGLEKLVFLVLAFPFASTLLRRSDAFTFRESILIQLSTFVAISWVYAYAVHLPVEVTVAACCLIVGMLLGLSKTSRNPIKLQRRPWLLLSIFVGLGFGVAAGLTAGDSWIGLRVLAATLICVPIGVTAGARVGSRVHVWLATLRIVWQTALRMGPALGGFIAGYVGLTLVYAALYGMLYSTDHAAFSGLPASPEMLDFYYFSLVTAATVGFGDIQPKSGTAKLLTCSEILLGLGWTLVVFSILLHVVTSHLNKRPPKPAGP